MCYVIIPLTDSTNPPSRSKRHRIREGRSQKITRIRSMWRPTPFSFCSRPLREILRLLYYNLTSPLPASTYVQSTTIYSKQVSQKNDRPVTPPFFGHSNQHEHYRLPSLIPSRVTTDEQEEEEDSRVEEGRNEGQTGKRASLLSN